MKILCFGDSNTWGYDPRGYFGGRYDTPWPEILAEKTGLHICNLGENGRQIPNHPIPFPEDTDLLFIMLGTNDLLQGNSPETAARRMEAFLRGIGHKVLLMAPPPMKRGQWVPDSHLADASGELARQYKALSRRLGVLFADPGEWNIPMAFDGVHMTQEGHRVFAERLADYLTTEGICYVSK